MTLPVALSLSERTQRCRWDPSCFPSWSLDSLPDRQQDSSLPNQEPFLGKPIILVPLSHSGRSFNPSLNQFTSTVFCLWFLLISSFPSLINLLQLHHSPAYQPNSKYPASCMSCSLLASSQGTMLQGNPLSVLRQTCKQYGSWTSCLLLKLMTPKHLVT